MAAGSDHTLALLSDGKVLACGNNNSGELGDGTNTDRSTFTLVQNLIPVKAVAAGRRHSMVLTTNGGIRAWGDNNSGQLGVSNITGSNRPVTVVTDIGDRFIAIAAGSLHNLALGSNGLIQAWGENSDGQLGDGATRSRVFPVSVDPGAEGAIMIDAGGVHSVALLVNGTVRAWGDNGGGRLGDGTTTSRSSPVQVLGLAGITAVAAGSGHSHALQ